MILLLIHQRLPTTAPPLTFFLTIIGFDGFLLYAIPNFYLVGEWFLGFIITMYILFPFLRYLFLKKALLTVLLGFFITLLAGALYHPEMQVFRFPLFRLTEFVLGMGFIYVFSPSHSQLKFLLIAIAGLLFYFSLAEMIGVPFPDLFIVAGQGLLGISVFMCLAVISGLFDNSLIGKFVSIISTYSFGAFLVHPCTYSPDTSLPPESASERFRQLFTLLCTINSYLWPVFSLNQCHCFQLKENSC